MPTYGKITSRTHISKNNLLSYVRFSYSMANQRRGLESDKMITTTIDIVILKTF